MSMRPNRPAMPARMPGEPVLVSFLWHRVPQGLANQTLPDGSEVRLNYRPAGQLDMVTDTATFGIRPATPEDERRLDRVRAVGATYVAVTAHPVRPLTTTPVPSPRRRTGSQHRPTSATDSPFTLRVHIYAPASGLAVPLSAGLSLDVDDAVLEDASKYADRTDTVNAGSLMEFMARELLLEPPPGAPADARRMVVSAGPAGSLEVGFRLHGPGLMADVENHGAGYRIVRLLSAVHDQHGTAQKALAVGAIEFRDMTARQRDRERIQHGLDLVASQNGYLAMWDRYQELEARHIRRRLRDFGTIRYTDVKVESDGRCAFTVDLSRALPRTRAALENTAAVERVEFEAAADIPASVTDTAMTDREWLVASRAEKRRAWIGEPLGYDSVTEVLRLTAALSNQRDPSPQGWLYLAHRGDQRRLDRREKAMHQLRIDGAHIPALPTLLEGRAWPQSALRRRITKLSPSALNCFAPHGPTPAQREAVLAALNTPDVAIIQGPPGTGKTQVIAALVNQLGDLAQGGDVAGSTLLTSFQHAAVDHLVTRGWVFGLPPLKVDSRGRGSKVALDTWRIEAARAADLRLRERPTGPHLAARRAAAELAATYRAAPVLPEFLPHFLDQVRTQLEHIAEPALIGELRFHRDRAEQQRMRATAMADSDVRADLLPYIRSLRCTVTGFDDDGPRTARALLTRLELAESPLFDGISYQEPLREAVGATTAQTELLDMLATLRDLLIDRLTARIRLPEVTVADPTIVDLLDRLAAQLAQAVTRSPDAIAAALLDYRDDLRSDPEGVDDTLRAYTVSLASTCQQAVSKAMVDVGRQDGVFESVVVDEAARANPLDLLIPLAQARRRIVLVGDHAQLPHMLEPDVERELGSLGEDIRDRLQESLFQRLARQWEHGSPDGHSRFVRLDTQFRMHPVLGSFVGDNFYRGQLRNGREARDFTHGIERYGEVPAVWLPVPQSAGGETPRGTSRARHAEAVVIAAEVAALIERYPRLTFGVISFYAAQVTEVWKELKKVGLAEFTDAGGWRPVPRLSRDEDGAPLDRLRIGTVDAFQGMEFSVTFLSTVRSCAAAGRADTKRAYGHLTVANRLCVAMSRQQRVLAVVGDDAMFGPGSPEAVKPLAAFLELCRKGVDGRVVRP
ncbi:AAA domain-containing protein [Streptomyces sp. NPDC052179]|uniref:DEAD/DEAH box helicase n=1 Tax=Streptomyces sp. NPDC052179 TaxID=3155680 RepID=UPI00342BECE9